MFIIMLVIFTLIALDTRRALRFVAWTKRLPHHKPSDNYVEFIRTMAWPITGSLGFEIMLRLFR